MIRKEKLANTRTEKTQWETFEELRIRYPRIKELICVTINATGKSTISMVS